MLGAVVGDIIGSPYEWNNTDDRFFDLCHTVRGWSGGREVNVHPHYTDDTVMTLAVARWLMQGEERTSSRLIHLMQSMGREYPNSGFPPILKKWIESDNPRAYNSYGNAAAARVSPIGLVADSLPEAISLARLCASVTHSHPEGINGAMAMAQAVWMARHGRSKEDILFAMENDFGYTLSIPNEELRYLLIGSIKEPIIINGEETGNYYYRETGRIDSSCQNTITAALKAFSEGDSFEDVVRRAVALGGDSDTICSMAGAIAEPFYGGVPEKISGLCEKYLDSDLKKVMESFESIGQHKNLRTGQSQRRTEDSFKVVRCGEQRYYVIPSYRKDIIDAVRIRFGADVNIIPPKGVSSLLATLSRHEMTGTYLEPPRPDVRTIFFQNGEFRSSVTFEKPGLPPKEAREASKQSFLEIADFARKTKLELQRSVGYEGEGNIHFANAYFPMIYSERVEIWKGDLYAGGVGIDPLSGLLKIDKGGDFGPMEWDGQRTENVFNSISMDSIKESISRFCLDDGIGIYDAARTLNKETANNDVAHSNDKALLSAISESTNKNRGIKMK